eukprot:Blabericola_migrator_1__11862@NODE_7228_length_403_cov_2_946429_g5154_i0_p1_GENE_NODE_7228_length_403_cov_2_946429_g5154_i0NODE_7228_length_403_cov_2_946429_g5154_i0_p1_ORF_typecomplete_len124_score3_63_NODE_7228_length_403_cov_2_946429_g5154_i031402
MSQNTSAQRTNPFSVLAYSIAQHLQRPMMLDEAFFYILGLSPCECSWKYEWGWLESSQDYYATALNKKQYTKPRIITSKWQQFIAAAPSSLCYFAWLKKKPKKHPPCVSLSPQIGRKNPPYQR